MRREKFKPKPLATDRQRESRPRALAIIIGLGAFHDLEKAVAVHTDVPCGIRVEMLDAVLRYQCPVLFAEMGWQTGVGHSRNPEGRILCPAINVVGNWLLSDFDIHATHGIGPAGQFNLLPTLTLLLAASKAVKGDHRVSLPLHPSADLNQAADGQLSIAAPAQLTVGNELAGLNFCREAVALRAS